LPDSYSGELFEVVDERRDQACSVPVGSKKGSQHADQEDAREGEI
jgi:hypothetical protein